jgi:pimeloyl-ACP methyl ester carboxylesterase
MGFHLSLLRESVETGRRCNPRRVKEMMLLGKTIAKDIFTAAFAVLALVFGVGDARAEEADVGGRKLHYHCAGSGSPTVILESGLSSPGDDGSWAPIFSDVQKSTRICLYDRAGLGRSDPAPTIHTSEDSAADLHGLLVKAGISPPYVLVGASIGGFTVRLYASEHPEEVSGLVLVDASHPDRWERTRAVLPAEAPTEPNVIKMMRGADRLPNSEGLDIAQSAAIIRKTGGLGNKPLIVISHSLAAHNYPDLSPVIEERVERVWQELQLDLVKLSSRSRHVMAQKAGHVVQTEEPQLVIDAIHDVLRDAKNGPAR